MTSKQNVLEKENFLNCIFKNHLKNFLNIIHLLPFLPLFPLELELRIIKKRYYLIKIKKKH